MIMADVKVRLFGVYRMDTHISQTQLSAEKLTDLFTKLNVLTENRSSIDFKDATVFINGELCKKRHKKLTDGDEIWLLSPASGG